MPQLPRRQRKVMVRLRSCSRLTRNCLLRCWASSLPAALTSRWTRAILSNVRLIATQVSASAVLTVGALAEQARSLFQLEVPVVDLDLAKIADLTTPPLDKRLCELLNFSVAFALWETSLSSILTASAAVVLAVTLSAGSAKAVAYVDFTISGGDPRRHSPFRWTPYQISSLTTSILRSTTSPPLTPNATRVHRVILIGYS